MGGGHQTVNLKLNEHKPRTRKSLVSHILNVRFHVWLQALNLRLHLHPQRPQPLQRNRLLQGGTDPFAGST